MFRDTNEQFLLSFCCPEQPEEQEKCSQVKQKPEVCCSSQDGAFEGVSQPKINHQPGLNQRRFMESTQKKAKMVKKYSLTSTKIKNRKMSSYHFQNREAEHRGEQCAKSQRSSSKESLGQADQLDQSVEIEQISDRYDTAQVSAGAIKKIRNLEARVKNMDLNYKTIILKLRRQNQRLLKQKQITNNTLLQHPEAHSRVKQALLIYEQDWQCHSFMSSSSSQSNQQMMPIMSKVQELKLSITKMDEIIKNYQETISKRREIEQEIQKCKEQQKGEEAKNQMSKKGILRKYSIPVGFTREKKSSFQTTMVSEIKQIEGLYQNLQNPARPRAPEVSAQLEF